jgi:hypothetical protein
MNTLEKDLANSLLETRNALALAMRMMVEHNLVDEYLESARKLGIQEGIGVRANRALRRREGEVSGQGPKRPSAEV